MAGEYPQRGELVIANVERVVGYGAFVRLEEYDNKQGMVSIAEFSQKWVKNPRNHLREGQKAVLKVLAVRKDRGHIDLSLKKVNDNERRNKLKEYKLEKRVNKLIEHFAEKHGKKPEDIRKMLSGQLIEDYGSLYEAFIQVANEAEDLKKYLPDEKMRMDLVTLIRDNIKPMRVSIKGYMSIFSEEGDGVGLLKEALITGEGAFPEEVDGRITYVAPPNYRIDITADDYKTAESAMKDCHEAIEKFAQSKGMSAEFSREMRQAA